jgi:hypothetical protein
MSYWIGSFFISNGIIIKNNPFIIDHSENFDSPFQRILIFAQPENTHSISFCAEFLELISSTFIGSNLSITGRLLESLNVTNNKILKQNEHSLLEHKIEISVSCMVFFDKKIIIGNAGLNLIKIIEKTKLKIPRIETLANTDFLGSKNQFQPQFIKVDLSNFDLVLASKELLTEINENKLHSILKSGSQRAFEDMFIHLRKIKNINVCYISNDALNKNLPKGTFFLEQKTKQLDFDNIIKNKSPEMNFNNKLLTREPSFISKNAKRFFWKSDFLDISKIVLYKKPSVLSYIIKHRWFKFNLFALFTFLFFTSLLTFSFFTSLGINYSENQLDEITFQINNSLETYNKAIILKDKQLQRQTVNRGLFLIEEASIYELDNQILNLFEKVFDNKKQLDNNIILNDSSKKIVFKNEFASNFYPQTLIHYGSLFWFFDSGSSRIFQYNQKIPELIIEIFRQNTKINNVNLGKPLHMFFHKNRRQLFIFDDKNNLFVKLANNNLQQIPLANLGLLSSIESMQLHDSTLYIYDKNNRNIVSLTPSPDEPLNYDVDIKIVLQEIDPTITGMSLHNDFFVFSSNDVFMIRDSLIKLACLGIEKYPTGIIDIAYNSLTKEIFIADIINKRIISCSYENGFLKQWSNESFIDIRSLSLHDSYEGLYVLTGSAVFDILLLE